MPTAHKPERDFCASCGFPIRGPRCEACGRGREPLPVDEARPTESQKGGDAGDNAGLDRAFEAFRAKDLPRAVGLVVTAEGGASARSTTVEGGPGWIATIRGALVFTSIRTEAGELSVEAPIARVPQAQRAPALRFALELTAQDLVTSRICLRDDLLLLRFTGRLAAQTPITIRAVLREMASLAARFIDLFAMSFDARPVIPDEERATASFDALGNTKRLRFGPGVNRNAAAGNKAAAPAAAPSAPAAVPPPAPSAPARRPPSAAMPPPIPAPVAPASKRSEVPPPAPSRPHVAPPLPVPAIPANPVPRPFPRVAPAPPSQPVLTLDDDLSVPTIPIKTPSGTSSSQLEAVDPRRSADATTTPIRRISNLPPVPVPPARSSDPGAPPRPRSSDDDARNARTVPNVVRRPPSGAKPLAEFEVPSGRSPAAESALLPADHLASMLRQAQTLAQLVLDSRPGLMSWLVRATVFRAVFEYRDAVPDAVAQLYRCTGMSRDASEPALLVMERIASARCQVPAEKPLTIEPFTSAPQAKEHVARYIGEIERSPNEPAFRHFLALGALSELLVRAKLPSQTEQRLREIVTFAQREGPKTSAFDLMMTSLQRISGG